MKMVSYYRTHLYSLASRQQGRGYPPSSYITPGGYFRGDKFRAFLTLKGEAVILASSNIVYRYWSLTGMTLSPFFGQLRGFLKVDQKPASQVLASTALKQCMTILSILKPRSHLCREHCKFSFAIGPSNGDLNVAHAKPRPPKPATRLGSGRGSGEEVGEADGV